MNIKSDYTWKKPVSAFAYEFDSCSSANILKNALDKSIIPPGPFLVETDYTQDFTSYHPLDDDTLFAKFADVESGEESFIKWTDQHGTLTKSEQVGTFPLLVVPSKCIDIEEEIPCWGVQGKKGKRASYIQLSESLGFWLREHGDLSYAVKVWEQLVERNTIKLKEIVEWYEDDPSTNIRNAVRIRRWDGSYIILFSSNVRPWLSGITRGLDVLKPALLYLQLAVSEKIKLNPISVDLYTDEQGQLQRSLQPTSLLSAMWYQFSLALTGEIRLRRCSICQQWENMRGHRSDWTMHTTCSTNKRSQQYRNKKKEAK